MELYLDLSSVFLQVLDKHDVNVWTEDDVVSTLIYFLIDMFIFIYLKYIFSV